MYTGCREDINEAFDVLRNAQKRKKYDDDNPTAGKKARGSKEEGGKEKDGKAKAKESDKDFEPKSTTSGGSSYGGGHSSGRAFGGASSRGVASFGGRPEFHDRDRTPYSAGADQGRGADDVGGRGGGHTRRGEGSSCSKGWGGRRPLTPPPPPFPPWGAG